MSYKFKFENAYEKRKDEADRVLLKYKDRVPVIVEADTNSEFDLTKNKFLVPKDISLSQMIYVIRKKINLASEKALFLFIDGTLPATSDLMSVLYEEKKSSDGFLYCLISAESTFGFEK